ncbi:MAG TPA: sensor histidine kinase, partial [Acidimicrobiales bacterium]|nr:sensor histidine kinase [Acidimicrobiales bacterium]
EILSREPGDQVPFDEIVTSLVKMAEDSVVGGRKLRFEVTGALGEVPADVATPLAVVVAELVQNAVEHAFAELEADEAPGGRRDDSDRYGGGPQVPGRISVHLEGNASTLRVEVSDNGAGLPPGFDLDESKSLGLAIVRDLVRSQLGGEIAMSNRAEEGDGSGTVVRITVPGPEVRPVGS